MNDLKREYSGERLRVVHCEGAIESFRDALTKVAPYKRKPTLVMHMVRQIETLANLGRLSGLHFPKEAELPNGSHFYALKRIPVRGYCWFSKNIPVRFISVIMFLNPETN